MKKLTLMLLALLATLGLHAASTVLWEGEETLEWSNRKVKISNNMFDGAQAGDKILAYGVSAGNVDGTEQDEVKFLHGGDSWAAYEEQSTHVSEGNPATLVLTDAMVSTLKEKGLQFQGTAKLQKVVLEWSGETVLWTGEETLTWGKGYAEQAASKFAYVEAGDKIIAYGEEVEPTEGEFNPGIQFIYNGSDGWAPYYKTRFESNTSVEWVIAGSLVNLLKEKGFFIQGNNSKLTKLVLVKGEGYNAYTSHTYHWIGGKGTELFYGTSVAQIPAEAFANAKVGDKILAHGHSCTTGENVVKFMYNKPKDNSEETEWDAFHQTSFSDLRMAECILTQEILDIVKAQGVFFTGCGANLMQVSLVRYDIPDLDPILYEGNWVAGDDAPGLTIHMDELIASGATHPQALLVVESTATGPAPDPETDPAAGPRKVKPTDDVRFLYEGNSADDHEWHTFSNESEVVAQKDYYWQIQLNDEVVRQIKLGRNNLVVVAKNTTVPKIYVYNGTNGETGIEDLTVKEANDAPAEYYTLSGVRVNGQNLPAGIYVKRQRGKTVKFIAK